MADSREAGRIVVTSFGNAGVLIEATVARVAIDPFDGRLRDLLVGAEPAPPSESTR